MVRWQWTVDKLPWCSCRFCLTWHVVDKYGELYIKLWKYIILLLKNVVTKTVNITGKSTVSETVNSVLSIQLFSFYAANRENGDLSIVHFSMVHVTPPIICETYWVIYNPPYHSWMTFMMLCALRELSNIVRDNTNVLNTFCLFYM